MNPTDNRDEEIEHQELYRIITQHGLPMGYIDSPRKAHQIDRAVDIVQEYVNSKVIKELEGLMVKVDYTDSDSVVNHKALCTHRNVQIKLAQLNKQSKQEVDNG